MRFGRIVLSATGCLLLAALPAQSILIETGPGKRVGGYLVAEDAKTISVRIKPPGGKEKVEVFERAKVKVLHRIDRARLEKLSKDNPSGYRDYAEELAAKKGDPESTDLALRLYLIAAYLDRAQFGKSGLLAMSNLAADPADARKYRALAFVIDPAADRSLLDAKAVKAAAPPGVDAKAAKTLLQHFRKALEQYRNGEFDKAQANAAVKGVEFYFKAAPGLGDRERFVQACKDAIATKQAADDYVEAAIGAEIWALDQMLPTAPTGKQGGGWSSVLHQGELTAVPLLSLETICEYDPRACVFRNGMWVVP